MLEVLSKHSVSFSALIITDLKGVMTDTCIPIFSLLGGSGPLFLTSSPGDLSFLSAPCDSVWKPHMHRLYPHSWAVRAPKQKCSQGAACMKTWLGQVLSMCTEGEEAAIELMITGHFSITLMHSSPHLLIQ
jgi:hypothetical protein